MYYIPVLITNGDGGEWDRRPIVEVCGGGDGVVVVVDNDTHHAHHGVVHEYGEDDDPAAGPQLGAGPRRVVEAGDGALLPEVGQNAPYHAE